MVIRELTDAEMALVVGGYAPAGTRNDDRPGRDSGDPGGRRGGGRGFPIGGNKPYGPPKENPADLWRDPIFGTHFTKKDAKFRGEEGPGNGAPHGSGTRGGGNRDSYGHNR